MVVYLLLYQTPGFMEFSNYICCSWPTNFNSICHSNWIDNASYFYYKLMPYYKLHRLVKKKKIIQQIYYIIMRNQANNKYLTLKSLKRDKFIIYTKLKDVTFTIFAINFSKNTSYLITNLQKLWYSWVQFKRQKLY